MNTEASKRIIIKIMANISALQNPMPILCVQQLKLSLMKCMPFSVNEHAVYQEKP